MPLVAHLPPLPECSFFLLCILLFLLVFFHLFILLHSSSSSSSSSSFFFFFLCRTGKAVVVGAQAVLALDDVLVGFAEHQIADLQPAALNLPLVLLGVAGRLRGLDNKVSAVEQHMAGNSHLQQRQNVVRHVRWQLHGQHALAVQHAAPKDARKLIQRAQHVPRRHHMPVHVL